MILTAREHLAIQSTTLSYSRIAVKLVRDNDNEGGLQLSLAKLEQFGWRQFFAAQITAGLPDDHLVGRVIAEHRQSYQVITTQGVCLALVSGKLRHTADARADFPAVGDWVVLTIPSQDQAIIRQILTRQSKFSRKVAGALTEEQVVAANIDTVFVVCGLNNDFNLRRIERYLTLAWESGARPVIILSKSDLCEDVVDCVAQVEQTAPGVPVHAVSSLLGDGIDELASFLGVGQTIAFIGSSGAGKSTLINRLLGKDLMAVGEVRATDGRGRHTTTHRQLLLSTERGLLIDTPGMRELQLWGSEDGLQSTFADIYRLAVNCRFADCTHVREPGCAVQQALQDGGLSAERYASFLKLGKELSHLARKEDVRAALAEKQRVRAFHRRIRSRQ